MLIDHPSVVDIRGLPPYLQVRVSNTNETIRRQPAILLMTSIGVGPEVNRNLNVEVHPKSTSPHSPGSSDH